MKNLFLILLFFSTTVFAQITQTKILDLKSPDGKLWVKINLNKTIHYTLYYEKTLLIDSVNIGLEIRDKKDMKNVQIKNYTYSEHSENINPVVPLKFSHIESRYNALLINLKNGLSVEFRLFNTAIAHRLITNLKEDILVSNELFEINLPQSYTIHGQKVNNFKTAYEEPYSHFSTAQWKSENEMLLLPTLLTIPSNFKLLVSEADLEQYPAMFLKSNGSNKIKAVFPHVPLQFGPDGDRSMKILREGNFIAKTAGNRTLPWRFIVVAPKDKILIENTMVLNLGQKSVITDTSWIKPGQVSWEWWSDASPYGPDVNFVAGYNLETYKYFIDFASKYKIPYIILDEGWAKSTEDPFTPNPDINLSELISYGKKKNVDLILWLPWLTVEKNFTLFKTFNSWGIKGIKIDFMDRSDQWMVDFYERVASEAAKNKLFVDFHGSFKPAGLELKYPNILSYEGVRGMEQMGGAIPDNSLYLPFIRNAVGPMDYTPGAMISMQPETYISQRPNSASIGTRAYQMALYIVFESGLQMLADNPTMYYKNDDCTSFITSVPTTWDETRVIDAEAGQYLLIAKRKGKKWFIGGITNNAEKWRDFKIDLNFLDRNQNYSMEAFSDGINAPKQAMDYRRELKTIIPNQTISIKMSRNGGWAAILSPK
ncbi:glycoside hydrolase family 97 protein [Chryseobacterium sp. Tr-659]|uniref:glycoside hydrolase family 97 protein n=1 Tax=Chryseobacterium sp. Tr-659 TaxID=2608340 RepID=UPI0014232B42|nr:glycoside hydrolase family 97 protein [Chryseobacterium sp. Tr-659]NIF06685.1 glycoside hydrolase family 97 protein [Chryseobacterium sp. Tr-659]